MADVNVYQLLSLAAELKKKSADFSNAAKTILDNAKQLDWKAQDLYDNANSWAGKGSVAFKNAWLRYHGTTINAALTLDGTAQALNKLASQLSDHAQQIQSLQDQATGTMLLTGALLFADGVQLGLDPFTDAATLGAGGASANLEAQIADQQAAIAELDMQTSTELETVISQIVDSTQLDQLQLPTDEMNQLGSMEEEFTSEELQLANADTAPDGLNPDEFYAKGKGSGQFNYKNPINMSMKDTEDTMPIGVKNSPVARDLMQKIKDKGVDVVWNRSTQSDMLNKRALGITYNKNQGMPEPSSQYVLVGLSPDATATTVYEEYLHVGEAEARGWLPYANEATSDAENIEEEIRVEYQVMQNAEKLGTTEGEWQILSNNRRGYIADLKAIYGNKAIPSDILQYFNDPPKPPTIK